MAGPAELLAAITARLDQFGASQDATAILESAAADEARQLAETLGNDSGELEARCLLGWFYWRRSQALPEGKDGTDLDAAIAMFTPCFIEGIPGLPAALQPVLAEQAAAAAAGWLQHALDSADLDLLSVNVDLWQRILEAIPVDHPGRAGSLSNLGVALRRRFEWTGALADLEAAIEAGRAAVGAAPPDDSDRAGRLSNLGVALRRRFEWTGALADLEAAIEAGRAAVGAAPLDHPDRAGFLSNWAMTLCTRFERTGVTADLDRAVQGLQAAAEVTSAGSAEQAMYLSNMAGVLLLRYGKTGALEDLNEGIEAGRAAVEATTAGNPSRAKYLSNLGSALHSRFARSGNMADLDAAIQVTRTAVETSPGGPSRAMYLSNLGFALRSRFERTGLLADLDAAIQSGQEAVEISHAEHPARALYLSNLGMALSMRFRRTWVLADLDAAIQAGQAAVQATPADHPGLANRMSSLGTALRDRFARTAHLADLDAAIKVGQAAVEATPTGHPRRPAYLSNLGNALQTRFDRTGELADLDAAIKTQQAAVAAAPSGHLEPAGYLSNLGITLRARFDRTGELADLDAAIKAGQASVGATPADLPERGLYLSILGEHLRARFERKGQLADREAASSAFVAAAGLGSAVPSVRIRAARSAAFSLAESDPGLAAGLLEGAVRLLDEVAPRRLGRGDQQYTIGELAGLASDAAAFALADTSTGTASPERAAQALRLLEAGRAVLLSQALDTRDDLTDLRRQHPALAEMFTALRDRLDQAADPPASAIKQTDSALTAPGQAAEQRRRLAEQFGATLLEIRALDGFASFGLPPTLEELLAEAVHGPVVSFNISPYRSDALLLTTSGVTSVNLPDLTPVTLTEQIKSFHQALPMATATGAARADRMAAQGTLMDILGWLWDTAAEPVLNALGYCGEPPPGEVWSRVWWAPGGPLGLLPLHAAGHHTEPAVDGQARFSVMDRVISSYTPTIRALRYARQRTRHTGARALIVAMPTTPGMTGSELPNVPSEAAQVGTLLPDHVILTEPGNSLGGGRPGISSQIPTRQNVFAHLPSCSIAHFACHAASHPSDPSKSLLLLHDHRTAPLTVASLAPVQHDRLQLVYLSACRTAVTPAAKLLDEAIHLTSAFQLAGSKHVIGTLWEINDALAADIAATFYSHLRTPKAAIDTDRAACALHQAVRAIRDAHPKTPSLWAAYLHAGA